jgi:hypothetical protein
MSQVARKPPKMTTGVSLDVEVLKYLDGVANSDDRDRSYVINRIVREWAKTQGTPIPSGQVKELKRVRASQ